MSKSGWKNLTSLFVVCLTSLRIIVSSEVLIDELYVSPEPNWFSKINDSLTWTVYE